MPVSESDISWFLLRRVVRDWLGNAAELDEVTPLAGGCINLTLRLTTKDGQRAVLKIAPHRVDRSFPREAAQLAHLAEVGIPVPKVYACHLATLDAPDSYILMEYIDAVNFAEAKKVCSPEQYARLQQQLAGLVLRLHEHTSEHYSRIGDSADTAKFESWPSFFRHVYDPIFHEVEKLPQIPVKVRKQLYRVHERLDVLLGHPDVPRLVHWDIWATNLLAKQDAAGNWNIAGVLDPNCKFAHAEAEIAYMELFHTATPEFLKAYQAGHKLNGEYGRVRKPVYQLYSLMNHLRLFGASYVPRVLEATQRMGALV